MRRSFNPPTNRPDGSLLQPHAEVRLHTSHLRLCIGSHKSMSHNTTQVNSIHIKNTFFITDGLVIYYLPKLSVI